MVKAQQLNPDQIIASLESGNFYSSTGVLLNNINKNSKSYTVDISKRFGITYTTQFIGSTHSIDQKDDIDNNEIGKIFYETKTNPAIYNFTGREIYVRAKIISDKLQENPYSKGDLEMAWTQPFVIK
jgi:hypothetical protein